MSADAIPTDSQGRPAKRIPSANSARSARPAKGEIAKPSRLQMPKPQPRNGDAVFDPEAFLASAGLGKQDVRLKKSEMAYAQGDAADAIFYVQKGQLRVTVTSANGKEATLALVGAGEFLGEDCMVLAHPLRLATATAMTECALLRISKAEMVRVLHQEPALSEVFVSFLLTRNARVQADLVDQLFNSSEKRLGEDSVVARPVRQGKQTRDSGSQDQPGNVGGDDWHNEIPSEFFYESFQKTGVHRLQRRDSGSQLAAQHFSARIGARRSFRVASGAQETDPLKMISIKGAAREATQMVEEKIRHI